MSKAGKQPKAERLAAFDSIVSRYEAALLRYAARIVGDPDAAQDIIQNTFIRLFRKWEERLEPSPQVSSWLYRVAHNCAVDHMRRESRRRLLHLRHAEGARDFVPPNRGAAFRISEEARRAAEALRKLSQRERQLVVLKVYEEKTYREISEITGLTVSNVGYILHHAMKKMAAELRRIQAI
jgi:RNA polymerase sigma-70 factor (ECF subfamily)